MLRLSWASNSLLVVSPSPLAFRILRVCENLLDLHELTRIADPREEAVIVSAGIENRNDHGLSALSEPNSIGTRICLPHIDQAAPIGPLNDDAPRVEPARDLWVPAGRPFQLDRVEDFHCFTICEILAIVKNLTIA